jgi:signal transduction histidine kinase
MIRLTERAATTGGLATPFARRRALRVGAWSVPHHQPLFWVALWVLVAAAQVVALLPVLSDGVMPTAGTDVVYRLMGGSFSACGLIAWRRRPDSPSGPLMVATGCAFFVPPLLWQIEAPLAQTVAQLLSETWAIPYAALLLTFATARRLESSLDRALVAAFAVPLLFLQVIGLAFVDVDDNVLRLVRGHMEVVEAIDPIQRVTAALACAATAAVVAVRCRAASAPRRRALLPSLAGALCLSLFAALLISDLVPGPRSQAMIWIVNCSLVAVPAAFLVGLLRSRLARAGLADLLLALGRLRGADLQAALRRALGDPDLVVARPAAVGHVDLAGAPVAVVEATDGRAVASVPGHDGPAALLVYDASLDDDPDLVAAASAATGMALEQERLEAESSARLADLQASRARLVAAGDAERRRLERDLHDGAQQRLVALGMHLRLLESRIQDDPAAAELLAAAAAGELATSLDELRELARGIHPAVLEHGLAAALDSLAGRAPVPTRVRFEGERPLPRPVELAAYFVASEALANVGKHAHATAVAIRANATAERLVLEVQDDGVGGADAARGSGLHGLLDRVDALHGTLTVSSPPGHGTVVHAELPCAS